MRFLEAAVGQGIGVLPEPERQHNARVNDSNFDLTRLLAATVEAFLPDGAQQVCLDGWPNSPSAVRSCAAAAMPGLRLRTSGAYPL